MDLDPQASFTLALGYDPDAEFDFVPSNPCLEAYNFQLGAMVREERLTEFLTMLNVTTS